MKVYFIGAGPGDPELITVKGKEILKKAEVVIYAGSLVNPEILDYAPEAEVHNSAGLNLEQVVAIMEQAVKAGRSVARVHTGDPGIYGAIQEQIDYLEEKSIDYEIIPGVSSFQAAAAAINREMTLPDVSQTIVITRQEGRTPVPDKEKLHKLARHNTSMAIFLSAGLMEEVVRELEQEYPLATPVAVVYKASWPEEQIVKGDLGDITSKVKKAGIKKTAMILVGDFIDTEYSKSKLYDKNFSHQYRDNNRKAILVASFGTSYPQTRKATIKACEQKIAEEFPAYEIRRAFTSQMVINKLEKKENLIIDNPRQGLQKLKQENFSEVIIQPLHIIPGLEYHGLVRTAKQFKNDFKTLKIGEPLFYSNHDYQLIAEAIKSQSPEPEIDTAVVLMGHGSQHPSNAVYACFDYVLTEECDHNIYVGTVEGYPGLDSVIGRLKKDDIKKVHLMPLMLVAGDHAQNDMAGSKDSWKSILAKKGFEVEVHLKGLGENRAIQQLYIKKVKKLVSGKQKLCAGS